MHNKDKNNNSRTRAHAPYYSISPPIIYIHTSLLIYYELFILNIIISNIAQHNTPYLILSSSYLFLINMFITETCSQVGSRSDICHWDSIQGRGVRICFRLALFSRLHAASLCTLTQFSFCTASVYATRCFVRS